MHADSFYDEGAAGLLCESSLSLHHHSHLLVHFADLYVPCLTAEDEEEVQPGAGQLAVRPADMTFEQAMRHYMDEIAHTAQDTNSQLQTLDNRQVLQHVSLYVSGCFWVQTLPS